VDETPSRPAGEHLTRADVPLNLPAGWDFDKVFGGEGKPAVRPREAGADIGRAYAQLVVAHAQPKAPPQAGVALPKTATDAELRLWAGLVLCALGLLLAALARRRRIAVRMT
jgi:Ca-activated chloride channel family protein